MVARKKKPTNSAKMGRPKIFPDSQLYSLRLPKDLHEQLQVHAREDGRSMNAILLKVIEEWWARERER